MSDTDWREMQSKKHEMWLAQLHRADRLANANVRLRKRLAKLSRGWELRISIRRVKS